MTPPSTGSGQGVRGPGPTGRRSSPFQWVRLEKRAVSSWLLARQREIGDFGLSKIRGSCFAWRATQDRQRAMTPVRSDRAARGLSAGPVANMTRQVFGKRGRDASRQAEKDAGTRGRPPRRVNSDAGTRGHRHGDTGTRRHRDTDTETRGRGSPLPFRDETACAAGGAAQAVEGICLLGHW